MLLRWQRVKAANSLLRRWWSTIERKAGMNATNTRHGLPSNTHPHLTANENFPTITKMLVHKTLLFPYKLFLLAFKVIQELGYLLKGNLKAQLEVMLNDFNIPSTVVWSISRCIARSHKIPMDLQKGDYFLPKNIQLGQWNSPCEARNSLHGSSCSFTISSFFSYTKNSLHKVSHGTVFLDYTCQINV